jgi:hypothetical protein
MKTSIDLPDDLYRQVKAKSALEGKTVREVATALFSAYATGQGVVATAPGDAAAEGSAHAERAARLRRVLEREIWPTIPAEVTGTRLSKAEEEVILGYSESGA